MKRIIIHWTAGSYTPSSLDKLHYHFLIDGDGVVHPGVYFPRNNEGPIGSRTDYAAHTRLLNSDSIGIAICAMAGAQERPFSQGPFPIKNVQWETLYTTIKTLCIDYGLDVTRETVLTHAEVEEVYGIAQRGKWDICVHPLDGLLAPANEVGDYIRAMCQRKTQYKSCGYVLTNREKYSPERLNECSDKALELLSNYFEDERILFENSDLVFNSLVLMFQLQHEELTLDAVLGPKTWEVLSLYGDDD